MARFLVSPELCQVHGEQLLTQAEFANKPCVSADAIPQVLQGFLDAYLETCEQSRNNRQSIYQALHDIPKGHLLAKYEVKANKRAAGGEQFYEKSTLAKEIDLSCLPIKFKAKPERFARLDNSTYQQIEAVFAPYVDDTILDIVLRLNAGTRSVNMNWYYLLVGPRDATLALYLCVT